MFINSSHHSGTNESKNAMAIECIALAIAVATALRSQVNRSVKNDETHSNDDINSNCNRNTESSKRHHIYRTNVGNRFNSSDVDNNSHNNRLHRQIDIVTAIAMVSATAVAMITLTIVLPNV